MPSSTPSATPKINVKALASEAGVAVEAYDTYDSDEETLAAAHRFAAALVERLALMCEHQPSKTFDAATLRRVAASLAPR